MSSKFKRTKIDGGLKAVSDRMKKPGTVDVGIIDAGKHNSGDLTVAEIGFVHEFGTEKIPERSFMRSTIQDKRKNIISLQKQLLQSVIDGKRKVDNALGLLGEYVSDEIRRKVVSLKAPPNALETIRRKGSSNPLVDTGQLKNSITYEVNK